MVFGGREVAKVEGRHKVQGDKWDQDAQCEIRRESVRAEEGKSDSVLHALQLVPCPLLTITSVG